MAQEASGHGLHDAATAFLEAATKKAKEEEKNKVDLVRSDFGRQHCQIRPTIIHHTPHRKDDASHVHAHPDGLCRQSLASHHHLE